MQGPEGYFDVSFRALEPREEQHNNNKDRVNDNRWPKERSHGNRSVTRGTRNGACTDFATPFCYTRNSRPAPFAGSVDSRPERIALSNVS